MPKKELIDQKKVVKKVKKSVSTSKVKIEKPKEEKVESKKTTIIKKEATENKLKEAKEEKEAQEQTETPAIKELIHTANLVALKAQEIHPKTGLRQLMTMLETRL